MTNVTNGSALPAFPAVPLQVISNRVDCSVQNLAAAKHEVLNIPAGSWVLGVWVNVTTPEGAAALLDVGDDAAADGWQVDTNANLSAVTRDADAAFEVTRGKYYAVADTIDVTPSAALDTAVFTVSALVLVPFTFAT